MGNDITDQLCFLMIGVMVEIFAGAIVKVVNARSAQPIACLSRIAASFSKNLTRRGWVWLGHSCLTGKIITVKVSTLLRVAIRLKP